jgi:hypothetical protein
MLLDCDDPTAVHKFCSMLSAFVFEARPIIAIEDAVRVELEAIAFRDGLKRKRCLDTGALMISPPSAMEPEPLFGVLPNPSFDKRIDNLRCTLYIDLSIGTARHTEHLGQFYPEPIAITQAYHAISANRAFGNLS